MGLSVSDILLQGCQNIVVEGPSDQHYLNAIKSFLIREKLIAPKQEIVFVPSGGVKGVPGVVSILSSKAEMLSYVLIDSDENGRAATKKLQSNLYKEQKDRIIEIKDITNLENSEVEDIIPYSIMSRGIDRLFQMVEDEEFQDVYNPASPILPQIEAFAAKHLIELDKCGWKVEIAKSAKQALKNKKKDGIGKEFIDKWVQLFEKFG